MRNVSRAWAYETGLAAGVELGPGMKHFRNNLLQIASSSYLQKFPLMNIMNILALITSSM